MEAVTLRLSLMQNNGYRPCVMASTMLLGEVFLLFIEWLIIHKFSAEDYKH